MATNAQIFTVYNSPALWLSVFVENLKTANFILTEDPETANHANRLVWAKYIFSNPEAAATRMRIAVLSNGDIQGGDVTDETIGYVVAVLTDTLANMMAA